jgi:2-keto-4-pentenoate hydratase/2-oxohepta-3-ene-1,7-dioic acid hydratase in catechol pathway
MPPLSPTKIICVGRNYVKHAAEFGNEVPVEPLIFFKPPSALIASGDTVIMPTEFGRVDYEGEIGVVIGRRARRVDEADAWGYVDALVPVNDVTARELQRKDAQWTRAKGFDTFCPVGEPVPLADIDVNGLAVTTRVNGEVRQHAALADMVFSIPFLIAYISRVMTLEPGDLIATGTPEGVGPLAQGDSVEVEVAGVGTVHNPVMEEAS